MVAIFCRKGCLKSAEHLQSVRFAEAISFSACHRNVRFSTSNNKRRSEGRKSTSLYLTVSNFNNKLCFIFVYLFVSWKDFFPFGCFALIHNSQPFFLSEIGQYNHSGEGWAATAKRKSIEISICRKAGRLDFYPFLPFPLSTFSSIHTIWQALIFQHKLFFFFFFTGHFVKSQIDLCECTLFA